MVSAGEEMESGVLCALTCMCVCIGGGGKVARTCSRRNQ